MVVAIGGAGPDVGGKGFETVLGQVWAFDPEEEMWAELTAFCSGAPPPRRFEHCAVPVARHVLVIGGLGTVDQADARTPGIRSVVAWNVDTLAWSVVATTHDANEAPRLFGHACCASADGREIFIFGGSSRDSEMRVLRFFGDGAPDLCAWRTAPCDGYVGGDESSPYLTAPREKGAPRLLEELAPPPPPKPTPVPKKGKKKKHAPKTPEEQTPVDFETCDAPAPRRGFVLVSHVPKKRSGSPFKAPVVLCFGGALVGGNSEHFAAPDVRCYDPGAATDEAIQAARARMESMSLLAGAEPASKSPRGAANPLEQSTSRPRRHREPVRTIHGAAAAAPRIPANGPRREKKPVSAATPAASDGGRRLA